MLIDLSKKFIKLTKPYRKLAEPYAIYTEAKKKKPLLLTDLFLSNDAASDREKVK